MKVVFILGLFCKCSDLINSLQEQLGNINEDLEKLDNILKNTNLSKSNRKYKKLAKTTLINDIMTLKKQAEMIGEDVPMESLDNLIEELNSSLRNYICRRKNICNLSSTELPGILKIIKNSNNLNKLAFVKQVLSNKNETLIKTIINFSSITDQLSKNLGFMTKEALIAFLNNFKLILEKAESNDPEDYNGVIDLLIMSFQTFEEKSKLAKKLNKKQDDTFKFEIPTDKENEFKFSYNSETEKTENKNSEIFDARKEFNSENKSDFTIKNIENIENIENKILSPEALLAKHLDVLTTTKQKNSNKKDNQIKFPNLLNYVVSRDLLQGLKDDNSLKMSVVGNLIKNKYNDNDSSKLKEKELNMKLNEVMKKGKIHMKMLKENLIETKKIDENIENNNKLNLLKSEILEENFSNINKSNLIETGDSNKNIVNHNKSYLIKNENSEENTSDDLIIKSNSLKLSKINKKKTKSGNINSDKYEIEVNVGFDEANESKDNKNKLNEESRISNFDDFNEANESKDNKNKLNEESRISNLDDFDEANESKDNKNKLNEESRISNFDDEILKKKLPYPIDKETSLLAHPFYPETNLPLVNEHDFKAESLKPAINPITKKPLRIEPEIDELVKKLVKNDTMKENLISLDPVTGIYIVKEEPEKISPEIMPLTPIDPITNNPLPTNTDAIEAALAPSVEEIKENAAPKDDVNDKPIFELKDFKDKLKNTLFHSSLSANTGVILPSMESIYKEFKDFEEKKVST